MDGSKLSSTRRRLYTEFGRFFFPLIFLTRFGDSDTIKTQFFSNAPFAGNETLVHICVQCNMHLYAESVGKMSHCRKRFWLKNGCHSMFQNCVQCLSLSETSMCNLLSF